MKNFPSKCYSKSIRRSLTLLEVLLASILVGGLLAVLLKTWIQLEAQTGQHHQVWQKRSEAEIGKFWIQDHLSSLVVRGDRPVLRWDGQVLEATCIHGSHPKPQLAGPAQLRLWCENGSLMSTLSSDQQLWRGDPLIQQQKLASGIHSIELQVFGRLEGAEAESWHTGAQEWKTVPRFAEVTLLGDLDTTTIPIFIFTGSH